MCVDDIIVTGGDEEEQQLLSQHLAKGFEMKTLTEKKRITDLLMETGKLECKPTRKYIKD